MSDTKKTPWRKNLDPRYISGEDLLRGQAMGKGLRDNMAVTVAKFEDAPTYDQNKREDVDKTALWLKEYPSGKMLYKPAILNVTNGKKLSQLIGGNSEYLEDFDPTKPVIMYAAPDVRHGHVVRFKKYTAPPVAKPDNALAALRKATTKNELALAWGALTPEEKLLPVVLAEKETLKSKLQ